MPVGARKPVMDALWIVSRLVDDWKGRIVDYTQRHGSRRCSTSLFSSWRSRAADGGVNRSESSSRSFSVPVCLRHQGPGLIGGCIEKAETYCSQTPKESDR